MDFNELLLTVQKPGRYIGGEWNQVKKEWTPGRLKVLLAFPDVYELGMSNLGVKILYAVINSSDNYLCERVFAPWPDFEDALKKNGLALYSLESRKPMTQFDVVGFSLSHELCYSNMLSMLDLGKVPLYSRDRTLDHPLVIAGGACCCNPEPVSAFVDAFVIGDGEEAAGDILRAVEQWKGAGRDGGREGLLKALSLIQGVYVPSLYGVEYNEDHTIKRFFRLSDQAAAKIVKRVVRDLDSAVYPVKQIVPAIQIVHDRIALEVMRGCKHGCSFCQARVVYYPCRERSREKVKSLALETYANSGYDEISLLSLSSGDYSCIREVIEDLDGALGKKSVALSVPSLRIEDILKDLPGLISKVKKPGLTFAPEAGSDRVRRSLNKPIMIDKLLESAAASYRKGYRRVKLYFMIGLPGETEEDILAITALGKEISELKRKVDGRPAQVGMSVNAFVPKPHTLFERKAMEAVGSLEAKRALLRSSCTSRMLELDFHSFSMSYLEATMSRGDRRLAGVIFRAWMKGARFDAWQDKFNFNLWMDSFKEEGVDPAFYVTRPIPDGEILPWQFIEMMPRV